MGRRICSFSLALFFFLISAFPASASSSDVAYNQPVTASGAIGGTIALSGYLSASGIHLSAAGSSFSDVELEIGSLWDAYKATAQGVKNLAEYTGSVVRGGYVLARDAWNAFGGFGRWLREKFSLTDNTENVSLSDTSNVTAYLTTDEMSLGNGRTTGSTYFSNLRISLVQSFNGLYVFYGHNLGGNLSDNYYVMIYNTSDVNFYGQINVKYRLNTSGREEQLVITENVRAGQSKETSYIISSNFNDLLQKVNGTTVNPEEPTEDSILAVDTSEISIPDDIPDTATGSGSLGGIMLPAIGAGVGGAAGAIAASIINGITDGDLIETVIRAAEVELPPDLEIGDDGDIFPDVLEIDPSDIFLESDGQILGDLFDYFPFSIPKTLYQLLLGLDSEPVTPVLQYTIAMPYGIQDISIDVDLHMFDSVAALLRAGLYLVFVVGWCKFLYGKLG